MSTPKPQRNFIQRPKVRQLGLTPSASHAWSQFVLDAAGGLGPSALAAKYGMTLHKVEVVLRAPETQAQVAECAKRLNKIGDYARSRLLAHAPDLVDAQLEVALGRDPEVDDNGNIVVDENGEPKTRWRYRVNDRMAAGRYCLDRILPTAVTNAPGGEIPGQTVVGILNAITDLAKSLPSVHSIRQSSHIYEGEAALPKAIHIEAEAKG